jgi:hypothetical protein
LNRIASGLAGLRKGTAKESNEPEYRNRNSTLHCLEVPLFDFGATSFTRSTWPRAVTRHNRAQ